MSWTDLIGGLANALTGPAGGKTAARPAVEQSVQRLPARQAPVGEFERAQAVTRRLLEDAAREMTAELYEEEVAPWQKRIEDAESKVIDIDTGVVTRLDEMERLLDQINLKALDAERLEKRLNLLIGLVAAGFLLTLWLGLRSL